MALPLADTVGLLAAITITGVGHGDRYVLPTAAYAAAVLTILAAGGSQRLRICLRVSDQAGRILTASALPLLALFPWLPTVQAGRLALWSAGLVFACRAAMCAALRLAHSHGLFTEASLVIGAGTFGAYLAELMRQHPEFGLRPQGFLDDGPPRYDLPLPTLGSPADLAEVVTSWGIRRVIVCYSSLRDEDIVAVIRALPGRSGRTSGLYPGSMSWVRRYRPAAWTKSGVSRSSSCVALATHPPG